jgi:serine protease
MDPGELLLMRLMSPQESGITRIEEEGIMTASSIVCQDQENYAPWGLSHVSQSAVGDYIHDVAVGTGEGVGVICFVIDTGLLVTHEQFGGRASCVISFITGLSFCTDGNGHGTHVAGIIGSTNYGIAKKVTLVGIQVLDSSGSGTSGGVMSGIDYARLNCPPNTKCVINLSLGGGISPTIDDAVQRATTAGLIVDVAAGNNNNPNACNYSPARAPSASTVGADTYNDAKASYSNSGSCVDFWAPGSLILSTWIGSNSATNTISGTSMAAPHVAGVACLFFARGFTKAGAEKEIKDKAFVVCDSLFHVFFGLACPENKKIRHLRNICVQTP